LVSLLSERSHHLSYANGVPASVDIRPLAKPRAQGLLSEGEKTDLVETAVASEWVLLG